jgi:hypothetical protein
MEDVEHPDDLSNSNSAAKKFDRLNDPAPMMRAELLEKSAFKADSGELIGKHPSDVTSQFLSLNFRAQNPQKAIREKCLDCCCGNAAEIRKCVAVDCSLWPFRMGTNPFRKKRELSPQQKQELVERLPGGDEDFTE